MAAKPYNLNLPPLPNYDNELAMIGVEQLANLRQPAGQPVSQFTAEVPGIKIPQFEIPPAPSYTPYSQTEEGKKVIEELTKKKQEAEERQQAEMNAARMQLQDYLGKQKAISYLPIAALVDTWTGSNLAKYYKDDEDQSKQMAMELQKELLKYGNLGVENQLDALKNQLGLGSEEARTGANLARQAYDAELRAKQAMFDTTVDAATKLKAAEEARKANKDLEEFKAKNKLELEKIKAGKKSSTEARQEKQFKLSVAEKVGNNKLFQSGPNRLKMFDILDKYENAVKDLDEIRLAAGPTLDPKLQERKTEIGRIYGAYTSLQKEVDELGALTGSDIGIIWSQMPNATDWWYAGKSAMSGGGKKGILAAIRQTKEKLLQDHDIGIQQLKDTYQDVPEAMDAIDRQNKTVRSKLEKSLKLGTQPPEVTEVKQNTPPAGFQPTGRRR